MNKSLPKDLNLYNKIKDKIFTIYTKNSAYRSGALVKKYKEEFFKKYGSDEPYIGEKTKEGLTRWFKENWVDVGNQEYPVYRPSKRISKATPLTVDEIDKTNLKEQIKKKQIIKGDSNLKSFIKKK
jgi:hypothetical protein